MTQFNTLLTELGRDASHDSGSVNPPVHRTSTLIFNSFADMRAYESGKSDHFGYGRQNNETLDRLACAIATLEGGDYSVITSSGLAATVLATLAYAGSGDHVLFTDSIYASTRKFVIEELPRLGIHYDFYDPTIGAGIADLIKPNTKAVYVESPGSLTFEVQDIPAIAKAAHAKGAVVIGDNTWGTPLYLRPFELGIDVSVQSVTKYIAGHSDLVMGSITCKKEHQKPLKAAWLHYGMTPGADNVYLALRGMRSLAVRMKHHEQSALKVAEWLEKRPDVVRVLYPALPSHPGHALWKRDLKGACGLFAFELKDATEAKVAAFVDALHHFGLGYSWGGYESLVTAYQPAKTRSASQWDKDCWLIRLNIGLEDINDLIADLENGFKAV
jgi:cystathionine beta-lyase